VGGSVAAAVPGAVVGAVVGVATGAQEVRSIVSTSNALNATGKRVRGFMVFSSSEKGLKDMGRLM